MKQKYSAHACVCVYRQSLVFYSPEISDLVKINLTSETVLDLEVINKPALERIINNWVRQTQFTPKTLVVLFVSDTYFHKDLKQIPNSIQDPEVVEFVESVPFSNVITKIFPLQDGAKIIAMNREFLQPLVSALESAGFIILAVSPSFATGITKENPFSKETAKPALKNIDIFTTYNFLEKEEVEQKMESDKAFFSIRFDKKLISMIALFVLLVAILIGLIVFQKS